MWLDYSQNINLTEKFQVQSAHYSGKQQTLHNTVLHSPNNKTIKQRNTYTTYQIISPVTLSSLLIFNIMSIGLKSTVYTHVNFNT